MIEAKYIELSCKIEDGIKKGVCKGRLPGIECGLGDSIESVQSTGQQGAVNHTGHQGNIYNPAFKTAPA